MITPTTHKTTTTRSPIAVWDLGSGPPVLLVHGFPDHPVGMLDFAERLAAAGYRCLLPALPGWAPSGPSPDGDYLPARVGADLLAAMDELEIERCALVGHDWGAELGFPLVAARPDRFAQFTSLAVPHPTGYRVRRNSFSGLRTAWYAIYLAFVPDAAAVARQPGWLEDLADSWSPPFRWDRRAEAFDWVRRPGVLEAICSYYRQNLDADLPTPILETPTIIVHGEEDGCIGPSAYPDFSEWFRAGLDVHRLPGCGHWPHLEAPRETLAIVLAGLEAASGF